MADGNCASIVTAFDFIDVQILSQFPNRSTTKGPLHRANAGVIEESNNTTVPVILLCSKLGEPLINQWWDAALLCAHYRM